MTYVLPGEFVPAKHVNLKLGPGLIQVSSVGHQAAVVSTKAGELKHSANNKQWWIEGNSRRVRSAHDIVRVLVNFVTVCSCTT
jgi:exosome complex component RRP40